MKKLFPFTRKNEWRPLALHFIMTGFIPAYNLLTGQLKIPANSIFYCTTQLRARQSRQFFIAGAGYDYNALR